MVDAPALPPAPASKRPTYAVDRLGALSDGVFAIVLTLLVLDLKVPELAEGYRERDMLVDLAARVPNFIAWLVSFILLARFWVVHHAVTASLARCHLGTMVLNFVVLGLVSLVPFAAALIGRYEFDPVALVVFAVTLGATGMSIGFFARHAATEVHLRRAVDAPELRWHWRYHATVLPGIAVVSIALAPVEEIVALSLWGLEPIVALAGTVWRK